MKCNIDNLIMIFQKMENDGININGELKWGYFFFNKDKDKLFMAFEEIEERGYILESLHENNEGEWIMQLSKIEIHSPTSLNKRNEAMNKLAVYFDIDLYDGWDVEKVE